MLSQCPKCGAPCVGDELVCRNCGWDLVGVDAAATAVPPAAPDEAGAAAQVPAAAGPASIWPEAYPSAPTSPAQWPTGPNPGPAGSPQWGVPPLMGGMAAGTWPTNCWRCQAPVYAGQPFCANCGLDYRTMGMIPVRKRGRKLIAVGALLLAVVVVAVGGFVVINRSSGWTPAAEPSPSGTWYSYRSPDNAWSVMFPSSATPQVVSQTVPAGTGQAEINYYMVTSGGIVYEAGAEDMPSDQVSGDSKTVLDSFEQGIKIWGTINDSRDLTFQGQLARELKFKYTNMSLDGVIRFWLSGTRVYVLMVAGKPGSTMYPEHFFDTFSAS